MKKTISILLLTVCIVISSVCYIKLHKKTEQPETALVKCFNTSGAKVVNSEIYFWGKLDSKYNTLDKLKQLSNDFSKELGIANNNSFSKRTIENDIMQKAESSGIDKNNRVINISAELNKTSKNQNESYISVNVSEDLSDTGLEKLRQNVEEVFKKYKISPKTNSCITGCFDGELDSSRLNSISKLVFKEMGAKKVEGMRDRNVISVSAYSPNIEDFIKVNGKKVNLNLAIRYNTYESKTYIWLATPVITTEY